MAGFGKPVKVVPSLFPVASLTVAFDVSEFVLVSIFSNLVKNTAALQRLHTRLLLLLELWLELRVEQASLLVSEWSATLGLEEARVDGNLSDCMR